MATRGGGHVERTRDGQATYHDRGNKTMAHIRNGRVTEVLRSNMVIRHAGGGLRTIVAHHGDRIVVAHGLRNGYVQRHVMVEGHKFVQRTYYLGRAAYVRGYREVMYYGVPLYVRAPSFYYPGPFYGWAISPWGTPVNYAWGWGGDPWFGYYHSYFAPYAVYAGPSLWLADFMIARTLQSAFEGRTEEAEPRAEAEVDAAPPAESLEGSAPMSDDVKHMVEQEVRRQLEDDRAQASQSGPSDDALPPSFSDKASHLFLAGDLLDVQNTTTGEDCTIGGGDAIQLTGGLPTDGSDAKLVVMASKGSSCRAGSTVSVPITDLVEMHNNMRDRVEMGLEALRAGQGKDNLPALPPDVPAEPVPTAFAASLHADPDANQLIADESRQADQVEQEVLAESGYAGAGVPAAAAVVPPQRDTRASERLAGIRIGQSESEVIAILGSPRNSSFMGGLKKEYVYDGGRVVFTDGDVSEVQVSANTADIPPAARPAPATPGLEAPGTAAAVAQGQSESEVIAILGSPLRVSFLGGLRKSYEYRDHKVIFTDGVVSEVQ